MEPQRARDMSLYRGMEAVVATTLLIHLHRDKTHLHFYKAEETTAASYPTLALIKAKMVCLIHLHIYMFMVCTSLYRFTAVKSSQLVCRMTKIEHGKDPRNLSTQCHVYM